MNRVWRSWITGLVLVLISESAGTDVEQKPADITGSMISVTWSCLICAEICFLTGSCHLFSFHQDVSSGRVQNFDRDKNILFLLKELDALREINKKVNTQSYQNLLFTTCTNHIDGQTVSRFISKILSRVCSTVFSSDICLKHPGLKEPQRFRF